MIDFDNLSQWLAYLETLHPIAIDMSLERVTQVANQLRLLPLPIPAITVTGTNGKGSSVMLLESIYRNAGYRVGSYISPHLVHYNERVRINGEEVSDEMLCRAFAEIEQARGDTSLTYFEFGTLAALLLFKQAKLDIVILEVGLGGRLDAVNIVDASVALITSISLDHQEWLGSDRASIAREKAGIMRTGKPVVCGDSQPPATLQDYANSIQAPLYCQGKDFKYEQLTDKIWQWQNHDITLENLPIPLILLQNAASVLQVIALNQSQFPVSRKAIEQGLMQVHIPGRQQVIATEIPIILDVAHNPEGVVMLQQKLVKTPIMGKTLAVFAMLRDKDVKTTVMSIKEHIDNWFLGDIDHERGCKAAELAQILTNCQINESSQHASVKAAFKAAQEVANPGDRIVVFGSFHTVAPIYELFMTVIV